MNLYDRLNQVLHNAFETVDYEVLVFKAGY